MKFIKGKILALAAAGLLFSCDKQDFVDINNNPDALNSIPPENQFLNATTGVHGQDFEYYYDVYRRIMPWMQYTTDVNGNQGAFTQNVDNFSQRYGRQYNGVGDRLYDLEQLVLKMDAETQPRYNQMIQIAHVLKAYYTFYVSDIYGSIPYSEAFQGRYGGTLQPKYDSQQEIFVRLDAELKAAIAALKQTPTVAQISLGNYDQYYKNDVSKWIKAANALRLRIAMRVLKVDAAAATPIINEVLASPAAELMSSNEDGWVFKAIYSFTGSDANSNWNPTTLRAPKPIVDFMWDKKDPRIDAFFSPNSYNATNIALLVKAGKLPAGTPVPARRYVGSFTDPDVSRQTAIQQQYYTAKVVDGTAIDTLSYLQPNLWSAGINNKRGFSYLPVITYAEFCFMRAELATKSLGTGTAKAWYEEGVKSSILWYDEIAKGAQAPDYTAVTDAEITAYLAMPGIAFDNAKALEQIASQSYLNFFKQPQEGWALWKRTGFPNTTSVVPLPTVKNLGATLVIPRRAPLGLINESDPNVTNKKAAYAAMAAIPGFGNSPQDAAGRVWWDKP